MISLWVNFWISNAWIFCILLKELKSKKKTFHVNRNFSNVGLFSNIPFIYLLTIGILPKLTFCCWLITDDNAHLVIQTWLKDFPYLTNDIRKANATWTGDPTGETLLQDANLDLKCLFSSLPSKCQQYHYHSLDLKILPWHLPYQKC